MRDAWSPDQYHRFARQRRRPFFDLLRGVDRRPGLSVLDLGCGPGELTAVLARVLADSEVTGVDRSARMLERARRFAGPRLTFRQGDIEAAVDDLGAFGLVLSNAALQWVDDHARFFPRLLAALAPGAQLAVQMPDNHDHPSHRLARDLARQRPFAEALGGYVRETQVLRLERYAELLEAAGLERIECVVRVYGHRLPGTRSVVEWTRGTTLVPYLARLEPEGAEAFLAAYEARLLAELGDRAPYYYPFRRMLLFGRRPTSG